jgi:AcrR family transcriptional regulator
MVRVKSESKRAEKARQTRQRMLDAARELLIEQGYGATSVQEIADRAGVAVQTIYFTFGTKRALLKELVDVSIAGDQQPVATMDRPWFRDALAAGTAGAQLLAHVQATRQVLSRVAEITEVLSTAAKTDPEIAELWPAQPDPRFTVLSAAATALVTKPDARAGLSAGHAADVLFGLLSPELYLLLVRDRGWTPDQWEQWAYDTLRTQLCAG